MQETLDVNGATYRVETVANPNAPYRLHGPRADYWLFRSDNGALFPVNRNGSVCEVRGEKWFSDKTGELRSVRLI